PFSHPTPHLGVWAILAIRLEDLLERLVRVGPDVAEEHKVRAVRLHLVAAEADQGPVGIIPNLPFDAVIRMKLVALLAAGIAVEGLSVTEEVRQSLRVFLLQGQRLRVEREFVELDRFLRP